jgi:hypothetical protein
MLLLRRREIIFYGEEKMFRCLQSFGGKQIDGSTKSVTSTVVCDCQKSNTERNVLEKPHQISFLNSRVCQKSNKGMMCWRNYAGKSVDKDWASPFRGIGVLPD